MKRLMIGALVILAVCVIFTGPTEAKQETDGWLCWTGGFVVPTGVSNWSRTQVRFRIEDEYGGWVAAVQIDPVMQGSMADFLYASSLSGQAVEVVTKAIRSKCGSPLIRLLDVYPWDGVENSGELG